jgi:hypothetical protein
MTLRESNRRLKVATFEERLRCAELDAEVWKARAQSAQRDYALLLKRVEGQQDAAVLQETAEKERDFARQQLREYVHEVAVARAAVAMVKKMIEERDATIKELRSTSAAPEGEGVGK